MARSGPGGQPPCGEAAAPRDRWPGSGLDDGTAEWLLGWLAAWHARRALPPVNRATDERGMPVAYMLRDPAPEKMDNLVGARAAYVPPDGQPVEYLGGGGWRWYPGRPGETVRAHP